MAATDNKPYRETLLINDQKNNQQGGLSYPKRIKTVDCRGCTCKLIVTNEVFWCGTFYQKTRTSSMAATDDKPYRETLLINDLKNN